jgi:hypothetical protein
LVILVGDSVKLVSSLVITPGRKIVVAMKLMHIERQQPVDLLCEAPVCVCSEERVAEVQQSKDRIGQTATVSRLSIVLGKTPGLVVHVVIAEPNQQLRLRNAHLS